MSATSCEGDELMLVVRAVPTSVSGVRRRLRRWLELLGWPESETDDIVLAVNEAIANVVDHAYPPKEPGSAIMYMWLVPASASRRVVVTVTDRGRWAACHPSGPTSRLRGRGLAMMQACMAETHVQPSAAGTTVVMTSRPVSELSDLPQP
jgi:anti-sigma regulatory factor (Ser/Thr protein kinase)